MKTLILLFIVVMTFAAQDTMKVLWLGNSLIVSSYSRTDEVNKFCQQRGVPVYNKYGAYQYNLVQGWKDVPANRDHIRSNNWDYVVLEVFSNIGIECSFTNGVPTDTNYFSCIRKWDALIDSVGAKTILYLPWGVQSFAPKWDSLTGGWKPDRMDTALMALKTICTEVGASMFPVGPANFEIQKREPTMRLWSDGTHGSAQGCYLGGLVCFAELTGQDPRGLNNIYNLDSQTVYLLQQVAWQTVFRPDLLPFGGLWTKPPTVNGINIYARGNITTLEQYLSVDILGDHHFTNDSTVTGSRQMLYRSLTPSVMTINHFGSAQAKAPGTAKIETRVANVYDTVTLTVTASTAVFDSVRITPRVFTSYVTNGFKFTATGYAYKQEQLVAADLTSLVNWNSSDTALFTVNNGLLIKKLARGGSHSVYVTMGTLRDSVRFTLLQDLALLLRLNFQGADTIYHPYWNVERGKAYNDSVGYGWVNPKSVVSYTEKDNIVFNKLSFLTNTANWMQKGPNYADSTVEGSYKIKCNDADYIIRMCLGHPYYHGRVSYVRCGANITKVRPDGSDTLFKFAPGATYRDPLFGIKTDTIRVRGEQGLFLNFFGPVMYVIVMNSDGVNIDSVAYDKWPMPTVTVDAENVEQKIAVKSNMEIAPNPFNPETKIFVNSKTNSPLQIYSATGRLIAVLKPVAKSTSQSQFHWNAKGVAGGLYVAKVTTSKGILQRKLILLK